MFDKLAIDYRILSAINMKQIGRHYYNIEKSVAIPQHKWVQLSASIY